MAVYREACVLAPVFWQLHVLHPTFIKPVIWDLQIKKVNSIGVPSVAIVTV